MSPEKVTHIRELAAKLAGEDRIGPEEAGKILKRSKDWVYKQTAKGVLPHYKNGGRLEYLRSELLEWLASRAQGKGRVQ